MRSWTAEYLLLLQWAVLRKKRYLPLNLIIQVGLAVGIVVGFSYMLPQLDQVGAVYLTSGATVMGFITVGMVLAPQEVAQAKLEGAFEFNRSLPVPRSAMMAADATVSLVTALPGIVLGLVAARLRFGPGLDISPLALPGFALVALCALGIGYGISYVLTPPATSAVCQAVVFASLMFSPINFPIERLPSWLAGVHHFLPFLPMARIARGVLFADHRGADAASFVVLALWCAGGLALSLRIMCRRG
ncbi:ABC transporter permease [Kitasatospora sp. NPDC036755]|uniref:ABC transporter permease n=1 Tax=Kitasatospora sp. NPDC036755 TaxID=3154600 RepID=UPI0033D53E7E